MIVELKELLELLEKVRGKKKIVFTNGCFDILHAGHADYLNKAKSLGDILVVGINSDASVRRIKGEKRPILPQQMRAYLLDNLKPVDYVVIFEEDTPFGIDKSHKAGCFGKGCRLGFRTHSRGGLCTLLWRKGGKDTLLL
jgi:cytidyltransferase-related domain